MILNNPIIQKAKNYVTQLIREKIEPLGFYYHNLEHTNEVFSRVIYLGEKEGLTKDKIVNLWIAALFHDTWLVEKQYENHEDVSAKIFDQRIQTENIPLDINDVKEIKSFILATKLDKKPQNIFDMCIKDADVDNLWREDFFDKMLLLKNELNKIKNLNLSLLDMAQNTYNLFKNFEFFTNTQKKERLAKWKENFNILKSIVENQTCFWKRCQKIKMQFFTS